jgi:hypothetical protein
MANGAFVGRDMGESPEGRGAVSGTVTLIQVIEVDLRTPFSHIAESQVSGAQATPFAL